MRILAWLPSMVLFSGLWMGCSKITLLRTEELRQVGSEVGSKVDSSRNDIAEVQKSLDALSLKQGGVSSQMRADLTTMLTDLQSQIGRLHADIDQTQRRLSELSQKLDRLEQRKVVISGGGLPTPGGPVGVAAPYVPATVKVVEGLDLENLFSQARGDYVKAKYDLAYEGFKGIYENDTAGSYKEQSLYWMGECLWKGDHTDDALNLYRRVLKEFPNGNQACPARFKIGLIYNEKQNEAQRNQIWNDLLSACPQSNEADRVKEIMRH